MLQRAPGGREGPSRWRHRADPGWSCDHDGRIDAAILDSVLLVLGARARRRAAPPDATRRETDRVPRQRRPGRRDGSSLPPPLRLAVPRTQRGARAALRLSRLEVRHRGELRRYAERAAVAGFQAEGEGEGLQGGRTRGARVGPYGRARRDAPEAGGGDAAGARRRDRRHLYPARLQLSAGARG